MSFAIETEKNNKILFLDANSVSEQGKYPTNLY